MSFLYLIALTNYGQSLKYQVPAIQGLDSVAASVELFWFFKVINFSEHLESKDFLESVFGVLT